MASSHRVATAWVVGAVILFGITGCPGSQCTDPDLVVEPVSASSGAALILKARLTARAGPIPGATISFYATTVGGGPGVGGGRRIGQGTTDGRGQAQLRLSGPSDIERLPGERVVSYKAEFKPVDRIGGTTYCRTDSPDAEIRRL